MAQRLEIYKCYVCGNVVEVVHGGGGMLWCCGRHMTVFSEKTVDPEQEEYFPVVEKTDKPRVGRLAWRSTQARACAASMERGHSTVPKARLRNRF